MIRDAFSGALHRCGIAAGTKVAVAVSGGADSMACVLLAKHCGLQPVALTVDHGLRSEAASEARQVGEWMQHYEIPHEMLLWEGEKPVSNIQGEARQARYQIMAEYCQANDIKALFTGHHLDDQAETVLLRLMRGSGVDGLSAMLEDSHLYGVRVVRPLLAVRKEALCHFLQGQGQSWVEDPSNDNTDYARVEVRRFLSTSREPELLIRRLADTAQSMQRSRAYIQMHVEDDMARVVVHWGEDGAACVNRRGLVQLHPEAAYRILATLVHNIGQEAYKPRFEALERLYAALKEETFRGATLGHCRIYPSQKKKEEGMVWFVKE